jgi:predicted glycosyltransferase
VPDGVTLVPLPPGWADIKAPDILLDSDGRRADWAWKKRRAAALLGLFAGMRPRLIVLDGAPSLFRFELRPLLEMARRRPDPPRIDLWPAGAVVGPELAPLLADHTGVRECGLAVPDGSAAAMAAL